MQMKNKELLVNLLDELIDDMDSHSVSSFKPKEEDHGMGEKPMMHGEPDGDEDEVDLSGIMSDSMDDKTVLADGKDPTTSVEEGMDPGETEENNMTPAPIEEEPSEHRMLKRYKKGIA